MATKRPPWMYGLLNEGAKEAQRLLEQGGGHAAVYMFTSPSGKLYIGVTNDLVVRLSMHRYSKGHLGKSIRKYGIENHKFEVLAVLPREAAFELERKAVEQFNTLSPVGLNDAVGGRGGNGGTWERTPEIRAKMSASMKGRKPKVPDEARKRQAESLRRFWGDPNNHARMVAARCAPRGL